MAAAREADLIGPMFRYDRPQAGRYRQFWQFDVEAIGDPGPAVDAEMVELGLRFYREAGLAGVEVLLNSIGDAACRPAYIAELTRLLPRPCRRLPALERDAARAEPAAPARLEGAGDGRSSTRARRRSRTGCATRARRTSPGSGRISTRSACATGSSPRLVRGLDYYTRTAFEFYRRGAEGQQQALAGGGRYDGLVELLGGKPTPGIGFGIGLDRVVLALDVERRRRGTEPTRWPSSWAPTRRHHGPAPGRDRASRRGIVARAELGQRKLGKQLEAAAKERAHFAVIIGDELGDGQVQVKDLEAGTQRLVALPDLSRELARAHGAHRHGASETEGRPT